MDFASLDLPEPVMQGIREAGFVKATPIQEAALPLALRGKDVAGQSQTGTGKTAAFVIAGVTRLLRSPAGGAGAGGRRRRVDPAMRNAAGLPVPVCDCPATSLPRSASGSAASWIGVAVTKPASRMPSMTGAGRSRVENSIRGRRSLPTAAARGRDADRTRARR